MYNVINSDRHENLESHIQDNAQAKDLGASVYKLVTLTVDRFELITFQ